MFVFESLAKCEFASFLQWRHEKKSVSYFAQYGKIENTNICFFDRIHEIISCDCIEKIVC